MTFDLDLRPTGLTINMDHLLNQDYIYLPSLKLQGQSVVEISVAQGLGDWHDFDLDLWPTDQNINRDHVLIKGYLPTKFEASMAKHSWVISCTRLGESDIPTDRPTCAMQYAHPSLKWGIIKSGIPDKCQQPKLTERLVLWYEFDSDR